MYKQWVLSWVFYFIYIVDFCKWVVFSTQLQAITHFYTGSRTQPFCFLAECVKDLSADISSGQLLWFCWGCVLVWFRSWTWEKFHLGAVVTTLPSYFMYNWPGFGAWAGCVPPAGKQSCRSLHYSLSSCWLAFWVVWYLSPLFPCVTDGTKSQVARQSLNYIQEIGNGWFGKVRSYLSLLHRLGLIPSQLTRPLYLLWNGTEKKHRKILVEIRYFLACIF